MHEHRTATLRELEEYYGLDDLHDMHLALDVVDELADKQAEAIAEATRSANKPTLL